jgi:hypothetical protein
MKKLYPPGGNRPYTFFVLLPTFDVTLDVYLFLLFMAMAMMIGYLNRSRQLARKQRRIVALEQEMVQAHTELLESQREACELEARLQDNTNPVIAMNTRPVESAAGDQKASRPRGTL